MWKTSTNTSKSQAYFYTITQTKLRPTSDIWRHILQEVYKSLAAHFLKLAVTHWTIHSPAEGLWELCYRGPRGRPRSHDRWLKIQTRKYERMKAASQSESNHAATERQSRIDASRCTAMIDIDHMKQLERWCGAIRNCSICLKKPAWWEKSSFFTRRSTSYSYRERIFKCLWMLFRVPFSADKSNGFILMIV